MIYQDLTPPEQLMFDHINDFYFAHPTVTPGSWMRILRALVDLHCKAFHKGKKE